MRAYNIKEIFYLKMFKVSLILENFLGKKIILIFQNYLQNKVLTFTNLKDRPVLKVEEVKNITPEEFYLKYFSTNQPVIFKGIAKDWPCCQNWNLEFFKEHLSSAKVLMVDAPGLTTQKNTHNYELTNLENLISDILENKDKYLRFSPLVQNSPELQKDINFSWLESMKPSKSFANTYYMFLGGKNQKTYLHTDQPCNLFIQIYGHKKWTLFDNNDSLMLYPELTNSAYIKSPIDISNPDFEKYPLLKYAQQYEALLEPGDVLYSPPHVWHFVENLSNCISVGYRFSSLKAAISSSFTFSFLRIFATNPPIWKTMSLGKIDTNLIWSPKNKTQEILKKYNS